MPKPIPVTAPDGREYPSIAAACKAYGMCPKTVSDRMKAGMPLEKALDPELRPPIKNNPQTDHLGNRYPTETAMCAAWGIPAKKYRSRRKLGWSLERALTEERDPANRACTGPDGKEYGTLRAMCAANGASVSSVYGRLRRGQDLEQAASVKRRRRECADHEGRPHANMAAMAGYWGKDLGTVMGRLKAGRTLEDALTSPSIRTGNVSDGYGGTFPSARALCRTWHVKPGMYSHFVKRGDPDPVASACISAWPGTYAGGYKILSCVSFPWFLCARDPDASPWDRAGDAVLHASAIKAMKSADAAA